MEHDYSTGLSRGSCRENPPLSLHAMEKMEHCIALGQGDFPLDFSRGFFYVGKLVLARMS